MIIQSIRIYAEVLEQGHDFREYIKSCGFTGDILNIYSKKGRKEIKENDSLVDRIRKCKDFDIMITAISDNKEMPLLMVEYSTAVPTDDHRLQRSDIYFWGSVFKVPILKISPKNKGMNQQFGGGNKISNEIEAYLAYQRGSLYYYVEWNNLDGKNILNTKKNELSCIYYSKEIYKIINDILNTFQLSVDFDKFYSDLSKKYYEDNKVILSKYNSESIKNIFTNSSRFKWQGDKLTIKINRFGHAMDPDRGILYFSNMINGFENVNTEIQINRSNIDGRNGYSTLFDQTAHEAELIGKIEKIIKNNNNIFSDKDALNIFKVAMNIEKWDIFTKINEHEYIIKDNVLISYLENVPSMISKFIFFLSSKLILTDENRNIICSIIWNKKPIEIFLQSLTTKNMKPLNIKPLALKNSKEDIITFASVELYKKLMFDLIAVSYPGAQGDRCILVGNGRNVKRIYVDIIASKTENSKTIVFLEECKENIRETNKDIIKLKDIINDDKKSEGLKNLISKVNDKCDYSDIKISIGAKQNNNISNSSIDYIFMFDINSDENYTYIDYSVALIDVSLVKIFSPLLNQQNKLKGRLIYERLFVIETN